MVGHIMPKSEHIKTCNEATQTIIRCYPHIPKENQTTKVYSKHGCQTAITISPKLENINVYPSLEFIPYERIAENSIRELDLPRKAFLHWRLPSSLSDSSHHLFSHSFNRTLTSIEDGDAFHQKGVLKKSSTLSILEGHKFLSTYHRYQRIMKTKAAQTTLNVSPHVLDADEVATVYIERCVQTSVTCTPNASISSVVPRLEAYLTHNEAPNATTEYLEFEVFRSKSSTETLLQRKSNKTSERVNPYQSTESMMYENFTKKDLDEIDESQIPNVLPKFEKTADPSTPSNDFESSYFDSKSAYENNTPAVGGSLFSNAKSDIPKTSTNNNELRNAAPETSASAISSQKSTSNRKCLCGSRKLNNIAHKLRVQASTLKLSQKVFPPGVQFEDRIIEVLNTTVAIFQTEIANILEVYVNDDDKTESCLKCFQETDQKDHQLEDFSSISTVKVEPLVASEFMDQDLESFESYCKLLKNEESTRREEASASEVFYDFPVVLQPPTEVRQDQPTLSRPAEPFGDFLENRHSDNIACECHPTAAGAAPSLLNIDTPTTSAQENVTLPPTIPSSAEQQQLLGNAPTQSWTLEDSFSAENNLKFEVLLKNTIKDVESCSAASTIAIRATISCPNTKKTIKAKVKTAASLPDLSEQVIRLSVLYKSKSTESEKLVEEMCFPTQVQIQMPSDGSHLEAFESELLIRCTSCECNDSFSTIGKKQSTNKPAKSISNIHTSHTKVENVRFSSMTCPVHPDKASCPPGPIIRTSVPQTQKQPCVQPSSKGNIEITVSCHLSLDSYKNNENDEKFSLMYEHEEEYDEPYISMLYDEGSSTGVQTDIALGEKLESTSLNSLNPEEEIEENIVDDVCDSRTEIPWQAISLPAPGSYIIKKQEKVPYVPYVPSDTTEEVDEIEPPESNVEVTIEGVIETTDEEDASEPDEVAVPESEEVSEEPDETASEPENIELPEPEDIELPEPEEDVEPSNEEGDEENEAGEEVEEIQVESEEKGEGEENEAEEDKAEEDKAEDDEGEDEEETEEFEEAGDAFIEPTESVVSKKSEKLIFQIDHQINEPYMEGLFKRFPDAVDDKDSCTSHTEMPWKDIVLPEHCTIRRILKPVEIEETESVEETVKLCSCRGRADSVVPPSPAGEDDVIQLHVGFDEPPSTLMPVGNQTASVGPSEYSDVHEMAKRVAKDYTFSISTSKDASSSVIVNIKPSTDCQFPSQKIAVCDDRYNTGKSLTATQSDSEVGGEEQTEMPEIGTRCSTSLPQMKPNKTARATISVKRLGLPDQTIIQKKQLTPGENIMTIQIPDEPIKINVKFSAPPLPPKEPPPEINISSEPEVPEETENDIVNEEENVEEENVEEENVEEENVEEQEEEGNVEEQEGEQPEEAENDEEKIEETEPVKEEPEMNPFKRDPIGSVLKAYETEMKPLRQALAQLQEKILSLNIPEIQAFMCPTTVVPSPPVHRPSLSNRYPESCRPRTCPGRSKHQVPPRLSFSPQADSSYNNNFSTRSPAEHYTPYPNSHYPFMAPNPTSSVSSPYYQGRDSMYEEPSYMESTHSSKSRQRKLDRNTFKMQENPYPQKDLAMQARNYGMYPDYRGRAYPDERVAYQNSHEDYSFEDDDPPEKRHSRKFKIRHVVSIHSREKMVDRDCGSREHPSARSKPKTSDKSTNKCRDNSAKRRRSRSSRKSSQTGRDLEENCIACKLRPGQALKTSPDEFLPQVKRHKTESVGTCTSSRIKITIPLE